jgi:hypothetical protein
MLVVDGVEYDDYAEDEYGIWTQVCEYCYIYKVPNTLKSYPFPVPIDGITCGRNGCNGEASYYVTLVPKEE